jgi:hypothetical protein
MFESILGLKVIKIYSRKNNKMYGSILWLEDGNLYLRLRKMSHTIYAASGKVSHIHRRMCQWDYTEWITRSFVNKAKERVFLSRDHALFNRRHGNWISLIICSSIYFRTVYYNDKTTHLNFVKNSIIDPICT